MQKEGTLGVTLLCFNHERVLEASLKQLEKLDMTAFESVELHVFDPGYPQKDKARFKEIVRDHKGFYYEMTNKGQTNNIRDTVKYLAKYDYVLAWEPDSSISNRNYLNLALQHFRHNSAIGYIIPTHQEWVYNRQGQTTHLAHELEAKEITFQGGWPQVFYKKEAWAKLSALEPSCKGPYGGTEYDIWKALQPTKGLMLRNVVDITDQSLFDENYKQWKSTTIGRDDQKYFEETLR